MDDFSLHLLPGAERLYKYTESEANIAVKFASIDDGNREFSAEHPFKAPLIPNQFEFDAELPFSSIYLTPQKPAESGTEAIRAKGERSGSC